MDLPVAETLKMILSGVAAPPSGSPVMQPGVMQPGVLQPAAVPDRLGQLFAQLQQPQSERAAQEVEDEIWAIWTSHADAALETQLQRAIASIGRRRLTEAEQLLDMLVRAAPDWAEAWNKRATLYFLMQRDAESIADIRIALQLEPRHFGAICGFGQICLRHGEMAAAAGAFGAALGLNPHLQSVRAMLAELEPAPPSRLN